MVESTSFESRDILVLGWEDPCPIPFPRMFPPSAGGKLTRSTSLKYAYVLAMSELKLIGQVVGSDPTVYESQADPSVVSLETGRGMD